MSINPVTAMDVDSPTTTGTLKRCSSAPMIHENSGSNSMTASAPNNSNNRDQTSFSLFGPSNTRPRRLSASSSPLTGSSGGNLRLTPRINQIRQEECADLANQREQAHEREVQTRMQISQSWEDLRLVNDTEKPGRMGPLQINLPNHHTNSSFLCNSPSPTRLNSPGFQSPTRAKAFISRSCSPVLRASPLGGVKRKLEEEKSDSFGLSPRTKRFHSFTNDRGGLLTTSTVSASTATSSPLPGSLSSVGTPESLSSADSPSFQMRMIDSPSPNRLGGGEPMILSKSDQEMAEGPS
ncbi:P2R1A-PPP2R2A-interacting phosphatase regulator 1 [Onthophagus taurus]|uniref:P2R1A-PPP2R2A-interacting phosphatase regulator 1 n=1 Tax=Onthophagus taurus TaxID=166361 RepID=UPI000C207698|nr:protein FAM122A [Onthophagus taurus]